MSEAGSVYVDLSNVAKDESLGQSESHASLSRWDKLRGAWLRSERRERTFVLVADDSLVGALDRRDQVRFQGWVQSGRVDVVPDADIEILTRAVIGQGVALSNDRFVDHRRLAGLDQARLVGWVARGADVRLQDRSLDRLMSAVISQRALRQTLKAAGLNEQSPELSYRWLCRDRGCSEMLIAVPTLAGTSATCPSCGAFLERGEPWRAPIWVKVSFGDVELTRLVLEDGDTVSLGRDYPFAARMEVSSPELVDALARLDPTHLELHNVGGELLVRDTGSERGTAIRVPVGGLAHQLSPPMPVGSGDFTTVKTGSKVVLGRSRLTLQRSGGRS